ncbi:hypothetical protein ILYODFUR_035688 [Ilyodon furcidens]|uniref:Uncharacterized protein n=1 Tax=Ilyodon furcidens TaxID=33524 RepID=A0ABV0THT6_9TELE
MCPTYDMRACNERACPINCVLTEFSQWSDCSPCAKKQVRNSQSHESPSFLVCFILPDSKLIGFEEGGLTKSTKETEKNRLVLKNLTRTSQRSLVIKKYYFMHMDFTEM